MTRFFEQFTEQAETHPEVIAIHRLEDGHKTTYGQLLEKIEKMALFLEQIGVSKGERVLILLPGGEDFICSMYACISLGASAVPVNSTLTFFELGQILLLTKPVGIISNAQLAKAHCSYLFEPRELRFVVTMDGPPSIEDVRVMLRFATFDSEKLARKPVNIPSAETVVTCHFTYKGLGYPIAVEHRGSEYDAVLSYTQKFFPAKRATVQYVGIPLYAIFGTVCCVMFPLAAGMTCLYADKASRVRLAETLSEHNVTLACLVPDLLQHMTRKIKKDGSSFVGKLNKDLVLVSGASALPDGVAQDVLELMGVEPVQGYGTSEAIVCLMNDPKKPLRGSLGTPIAGAEVRIEDAYGHKLPNFRVGEIMVRGSTVSQGFVGRPRETALFFRDGWFRTGDLGYSDENGNIFFSGRRYPFAKVGSQMVDLVELESVAMRHPAVARAKALVETDANGLSYTVIFAVTKYRMSVSEKELYRFCRAHLSSHKVPRVFRFYKSRRTVEIG